MKCPCQECLKFPLCVSKKSITCEDLYKFCIVLHPGGQYKRPQHRHIRVIQMLFNKSFAGSVRSQYRIVLEENYDDGVPM